MKGTIDKTIWCQLCFIMSIPQRLIGVECRGLRIREAPQNPNFARKARELASLTRSSSNGYGEIFLCVFRKKLTLLFLRIPRTARRTTACTSTQASEPPFGLRSLPTSLLPGCSTRSRSVVCTRTSSPIPLTRQSSRSPTRSAHSHRFFDAHAAGDYLFIFYFTII
jgi:hypothetical protein